MPILAISRQKIPELAELHQTLAYHLSKRYHTIIKQISDSDQSAPTQLSPEISALNARLILPRPSDHTVSHISLRDFSISKIPQKNSELFSNLQSLFSCGSDQIKVCQRDKHEIFVHVDLEKEQKTPRSVIFEAVYFLWEFLSENGGKIKRIRRICMPFVHFGKVRISLKIEEEKKGNVQIYNFFGSLFGLIEGISCSDESEGVENLEDVFLTEDAVGKTYSFQENGEANSEKCQESPKGVTETLTTTTTTTTTFLLDILQDQMGLLKSSESLEDVSCTPLPYLGIDSLRLAELEFHVANSERFRDFGLKGAFLMAYKTLGEVSDFLDAVAGKRDETSGIQSSHYPEAVKNVAEQKRYQIPLSSQQKRILFVSELEKDSMRSEDVCSSQFSEPIILKFSSKIDVPRVQSSLNALIMKHSILRTFYLEDYQVLMSGTECYVKILQEEEGNNVQDFHLKCHVYEDEFHLKLIFHHISIDGRSLSIFYKDFLQLYSGTAYNSANKLQYHDYCTRECKVENKESQKFWSRYLDETDNEQLPTDFPRNSNSEQQLIGSCIQKTFPANLQKKFDTVCLRNSLSKFELFFALLETSMRRIFGLTETFTMGFAVDLRFFEFADTMGCFTNVLPYVSEKTSNDLTSIQKTLRSLRAHGSVPYQQIVKLSVSANILEFEVFVVSDIVEVSMTPEPQRKKSVRFSDDVQIEVVQNENQNQRRKETKKQIAKYPMTWYVRQYSDGKLGIEVEYARDLWRAETIKYILDDIFRQINKMTSKIKSSSPPSSLVIIKKSDFPKNTVYQNLPKNPRIRCKGEDVNLNHLEMSAISQRLLSRHLKKYGQRLLEHPVLFKLPRTSGLIKVVISTWQAGFYPVPLHGGITEAGVARIREGLTAPDAEIVTEEVLKELTSQTPSRQKQKTTRNSFTPQNFCYVTCTSGSTGVPKLVGTCFHGHSNLILQYTKTFQLNSEDVICQTVDPSFDIFFADVFKCLLNDARLQLCHDPIPTCSELSGCSNAYIMPALISRLSVEGLKNLKTLQYGGESVAPKILEELFKKRKDLMVFQEFGLTEQTVYSMRNRIKMKDGKHDVRNLGTLYDNIGCFLANSNNLKVCLQGQLVLCGVGLMRGYFGITKDVLKAFPTGDEVCRRADGRLEFLGRRDSQVKVRGHRVDLFEIECTAYASNLVETSTCIVSSQNQQLVLFFKPNNSTDIKAKLQNHLEQQLVQYKVPARLVNLQKFPLTRTGKIDKQALQKMVEDPEEIPDQAPEKPTIISKPETITLQVLLKKWLEYYSEVKIPSEDVEIFAAGVDSIAVMLAMQKLRAEGFDIPIKKFFELKTLRRILVWYFQDSSEDVKIPLENIKLDVKNPRPSNLYINLNHVQQRILFLSRMMTSQRLFRMNFSIPLNGPLDLKRLGLATNTIILGNPLLRSLMKREGGEYRFFPLSGTESYRNVKLSTNVEVLDEIKKSPSSSFETFIWLMMSKPMEAELKISIHHIICDGRSLQILKNQLESILNSLEDIEDLDFKFQKNFDLPEDNSLLDEVKVLKNFAPMFTKFQIGANKSISTKFQFKIQGTEKPSLIFSYCQAISHVFQISEFPIACTFANRNPDNWNTISMFANTLPVPFTSSDTLETFSEKVQMFNENSNISLTSLLTASGKNFADFAVNFHETLESLKSEKEEEEEDVCQFPMLLTFAPSQNSAILEFDASVITRRQAEDVRDFIAEEPKEQGLNFLETFKKFLNQEDLNEDSNFFQSGGHSLIAMKLIDFLSDELDKELPIKLIFENPTPKTLERAVRGDFSPMPSKNSNFQYPLSRQQLQMFYLSEFTSNSLEYQLPFIQPFPSTLDVSKIHKSLLMTIQEQTIFRTAFRVSTDSGDPYQEVLSMTECFIRCHVDQADSHAELADKIRELCDEPIEVLSGVPLVKAGFVVGEKNVAFLHLHHLISDARSTQLTNSTMRWYLEDPGRMPRRLKMGYVDYCKESELEDVKIDEEYIKSLTEGIRFRHENLSKIAEKSYIEIPVTKSSESPFSKFLKAISTVLLQKFQQKSINITFPSLNRNEKTSGICGYFLNNLLINSSKLDDLPTILHRNLPYSDVIREVRTATEDAGPVSEIYLNCRYDLEFDETDDDELLALVPMKLHFPVELDVDLMGQVYRVTMRSDRFRKEELEQILRDIGREVGGEASQSFSVPKVMYGLRKDFPSLAVPNLYTQLFSFTSSSYPFALTPSESYSYRQTFSLIRSFSSTLSRQFLTSRCTPIRSDDVIAVIGSKSVKTTIRCLAVQYSGATYLPVDELYPEERKREILNDSVFVFNAMDLEFNSSRHFNISTTESLAYVITTSGTTGKPKSVAISCYSLANLCLSSTLSMNIMSTSRIFQFTNFVFDNSVLEVSMTIASGAALVYSDGFEPSNFQNLIEKSPGITHCLLFPSLVQSFSISKIQNLAYWIVGGERLPQKLLDEALAIGCHVIQNYGPTETTAFAVARRMKKGDKGQNIGRPAVNSVVRIAREGELQIYGAGRMRGYLNRDRSWSERWKE
uniref:Carrier domain-containing protein n=1 Tax=Caenorhabditis japonica TaxID=281687 RepID=A0A8R1DYI0_CAEJA